MPLRKQHTHTQVQATLPERTCVERPKDQIYSYFVVVVLSTSDLGPQQLGLPVAHGIPTLLDRLQGREQHELGTLPPNSNRDPFGGDSFLVGTIPLDALGRERGQRVPPRGLWGGCSMRMPRAGTRLIESLYMRLGRFACQSESGGPRSSSRREGVLVTKCRETTVWVWQCRALQK